jgi:C-terminal processing protease CtpA/Prc
VRVIADSPADQAGLQTGDLIASVDDIPLIEASYPAVAGALATPEGQRRRFDLLRDGAPLSAALTAIPLL